MDLGRIWLHMEGVSEGFCLREEPCASKSAAGASEARST